MGNPLDALMPMLEQPFAWVLLIGITVAAISGHYNNKKG